MVFYFSGTGNSLQAAQAMLSPGEKLYDMAECLWKKEFTFHVAPGEAAGFVFPVYFGGLPAAVEQFIDALDMPIKPYYCYGLMTCGGNPAAAGEELQRRLKRRGMPLHAAFKVVMPDNYILMYKIDEPEEQRRILDKAALWLDHIKKQVDQRSHNDFRASFKDRLMTAAMRPMYEKARTTKYFYADDQCVGCGLCAKRCTAHVIEMVDGRPAWTGDKCNLCMACARCGAIQYGKKTAGKKRYTNPILKKAGGSHDSDSHTAAAGGHDHGGAASGGHDHGAGGEDCCCPPDEGGGHDRGGAAPGGHDHGAGGEDCCPPQDSTLRDAEEAYTPDPTMTGEE